MTDQIPPSLPGWAIDALRTPVTSRAGSRDGIMRAVRGLPAPRRLSAPAAAVRASRWFRRGSLTGAGSVLLTAVLAFMVSVHRGDQLAVMAQMQTSAVVLGDTVVPAVGAPDSLGARLLDTLRIVQFAIRGPHIGAAEVIGTFNGWHRGSTAMASASRHSDEWRARVLVPRDALDFAFVVSDASETPMRERVIPAAPLPAQN
ncbi:hypothetical protein [Gemmatimonas groenlandica]|uniref:Uncharacterized protein n=1 Tax=Gemmatimonas groenlandica TaxID=2732249 RepID=A0A6M4IS13_9BACT|nr:hypothetical protein [Gemmatimonas groenlandica]QJR36818.1 hypothetical protein HKW67_15480 [Gemmatimonas groenlandica]